MGRVSGEKRMFEKSKNVVQFLYYILAILFILITIWLTLILPNIDFPIYPPINGTLPPINGTLSTVL